MNKRLLSAVFFVALSFSIVPSAEGISCTPSILGAIWYNLKNQVVGGTPVPIFSSLYPLPRNAWVVSAAKHLRNFVPSAPIHLPASSWALGSNHLDLSKVQVPCDIIEWRIRLRAGYMPSLKTIGGVLGLGVLAKSVAGLTELSQNSSSVTGLMPVSMEQSKAIVQQTALASMVDSFKVMSQKQPYSVTGLMAVPMKQSKTTVQQTALASIVNGFKAVAQKGHDQTKNAIKVADKYVRDARSDIRFMQAVILTAAATTILYSLYDYITAPVKNTDDCVA